MSKNPLLDEVFLQKLYLNRHKEIYAKIIALNLQEEPVEQIEGQVTGGSVSLDGSSNVRRSCNLTMVAQNVDINAYYWGFKHKFQLFIGLKNNVDNEYDDIIWFPFGTMIITNFSTSLSTNGYSISISGKDKMCLLNGELSGSLFASVDFGKEEYYDRETKITTITDIPIKQIIREAVHEYAQEPWENIIINDLDDYGLELLDYRGSLPLYLIIDESSGSNEDLGDVVQITLNGDTTLYLNGITATTLKNISRYNPRNGLDLDGAPVSEYDYFSWAAGGNPVLSIAKIEYGQTCGYRYTDITYAGDLVLSIGEPVTAMLDKLVQMLGNWEYFYDTDGHFVFQRKKTYLDKTWNNIVTNNDDSYIPTLAETYVESAMYSSAISWNFTDSFLTTAFNNTPVLSNVRNDYSIWGTKKSISGVELPVHLRYAIDKKPQYYHTLVDSRERYAYRSDKIFITKEYYEQLKNNTEFQNDLIETSALYDTTAITAANRLYEKADVLNDNTALFLPENTVICDWREIIFEMALDARQHQHEDDFPVQMRKVNGFDENGEWRYPTGKTGYEQYYTDLEGFWRQLYCPPQLLVTGDYLVTGVWTDREQEGDPDYFEVSEPEKENILYFLSTNWVTNGMASEQDGWNMEVVQSPATINFWFDFLDVDSPSGQNESAADFVKYSVPTIGDRAKSVNDNMVKAIYFREIPNTIFVQDLSTAQRKAGYTYMQYQENMETLFTVSSQGKCAIDVLEEWLNNYVYAIESVNVTSVPIYHLQPNTRVKITDIASNINGEYIVSRISIPLAYNGTMSITATKVADRIY